MAYTLIEGKTLTSTTNSVVFSSIPSTYIDLSLVVCARGNTSSLNLLVSTNNSGNIWELLTFYNSSFTSAVPQSAPLSSSLIQYAYEASTSTTANTFSNTEVYFRNYSSSLMKKMIVQSGVMSNTAQGSAGGVLGINAAYQNTTGVINSITLQPDVPGSNVFQIGSTFYLYGIS